MPAGLKVKPKEVAEREVGAETKERITLFHIGLWCLLIGFVLQAIGTFLDV